MKNVSKRAILTVLLAIAFVVTFACGALFTLVMNQSNLAIAAGESGSTATLTTNTTTVKRGGTVDVTLTIPMPADMAGNDDYYWNAIAMTVGPLNTTKDGYDTDLAKELSVEIKSGKPSFDYGDMQIIFVEDSDSYTCYQTGTTGDYFNKVAGGGLGSGFVYWSINLGTDVYDGTDGSVFSDMVYHGTLKLTTTICVPENFSKDEITFGVGWTEGNKVGIASNSQKKQNVVVLSPYSINDTVPLTRTEVKVDVVSAATEANLKEVNVGHGDALTDATPTELVSYVGEGGVYNTTGTYDCKHFALFPLLLKPVLADDTVGATVKIGFVADSVSADDIKQTIATNGKIIDPDVGWVGFTEAELSAVNASKAYIYVQAENCVVDESGAVTSGKTQIYELVLSNSYVGLESLVFTDYSAMAKTTDAADGSSTAPTKVGLFDIPEAGNNEAATTFDPEVLEYKYYLLSDSFQTDGDLSLTLTLNATVPADKGLSTSIALAEVIADGGTAGLTLPDPATAISGTAFDIEMATASATYDLTLTVTKDGDTSVNKVYTIHVQVVNCDVSITTLQALGTNGTYNSSASIATQNSVDYYFSLNKETDTTASVIFTTNAEKLQYHTDTLGDIDPTSTGTFSGLEVGKDKTHTLLATAEAGNTQKYTFILAKPEALSLALSSKYQFLYKTSDESSTYRTAYGEKGLIHGKDDKDGNSYGITRYVLGQILPVTTIKSFVENIDETQHEILWIYDQSDRLIYKLGTVESAYVNDYDATYFPVGTGWRVELKVNESSTPIDTVYLSILGDVSGDGIINAFDVSLMNAQIIADVPFDPLEVQLAASTAFSKSCTLDATAVSAVNDVIRGDANIDDTFYIPNQPSNP